MALKKDFMKSVMISIFWLRVSGITMNELDTKKPFNYFVTHWLFYFNILWLYSSVFGEFNYIKYALEAGKDIIQTSSLFPCIAVCFLSLGKGLFLFMNQDTMKSVLYKFNDIHPNTDMDDDDDDDDRPNEVERKIVKDAMKMIYITITFLGAIVSVVLVCFYALPIVIMIHSYHTTGEYEFKTPFLVKYFFEMDTTFKWLLIYIHHIWSTLIVCGNVYGNDILVLIFCSYIKMHFELICKRFENVICPTSMPKTRQNIKKLIIRHQELLGLVEQMDFLFSKSTLIQCVISSMTICFCLFTAAFTEDMLEFVTFALFFIMTLVEILLLSYFGDMLISASTEFGTSVYNCDWYNLEPEIIKDIIFIIQRSQTPCKISAMGYADLKLTTFTSILSSSWSYFALLKTMYD